MGQKMSSPIDFEEQLRRSKGRSSRTRVVSAKLTKSEQQELEEAAKAESKSLSEWARETLLEKARRPKHDPLFTELVATRMYLVNMLKPLVMGQKFTQEDFAKLTTTIRAEKRKAAEECLQQYAPEPKKAQ
jgi:hypothetical protein